MLAKISLRRIKMDCLIALIAVFFAAIPATEAYAQTQEPQQKSEETKSDNQEEAKESNKGDEKKNEQVTDTTKTQSVKPAENKESTKKEEPKKKSKKGEKGEKKININKFKKQERKRLEKDTLPDLRRFKVEGGVLKEILPVVLTDTIKRDVIVPDSMLTDTVAIDSLERVLSKKEQRRLERELQDSTFTRHSRIFRDSIPISRMSLISLAVPGFSQLYNRQAWKIPILYTLAGSTLALGFQQNCMYRNEKRHYDALIRANASRELIDPVQTRMIQHNTYRQLLFAGALATYIYFIGDGAVNYDGEVSPVKKATTLSTICPGAGQVYNKSYWKLPIVLGGFATMAYIIDFNNRGYKRFKLAYDFVTDGDETTVDEFNGRYSDSFLSNLKRSYRRNRDLCLIITGAFYLLNIIDAHVDAHLKDYDISDDLAINVEPVVTNFYSRKGGMSNMVGMSINFKF